MKEQNYRKTFRISRKKKKEYNFIQMLLSRKNRAFPMSYISLSFAARTKRTNKIFSML